MFKHVEIESDSYLSDEEVWIRIAEYVVCTPDDVGEAVECADRILEEFKKRFRKEEETEN